MADSTWVQLDKNGKKLRGADKKPRRITPEQLARLEPAGDPLQPGEVSITVRVRLSENTAKRLRKLSAREKGDLIEAALNGDRPINSTQRMDSQEYDYAE